MDQNSLNLIVGGDSTIGGALSHFWSKINIPFHSSTRHKEFESNEKPFIDLLDNQTFKNLLSYESVVICAGITNMKYCENNPKETRTVNVCGTIELIKKLVKEKTHIVFISTNQVFNGKKPMQKPDAPRKPINEYGKQKAEVEEFIENISNSCILRLTKVVEPEMTLLNNWKKCLSESKPISAFTNMSLSPINIDKVVKKINILAFQKKTGIFQLSGGDDITYFEFAQDFAEMNGYSRNLVTKDTWEGKLDFEPPKYTSMLNV